LRGHEEARGLSGRGGQEKVEKMLSKVKKRGTERLGEKEKDTDKQP